MLVRKIINRLDIVVLFAFMGVGAFALNGCSDSTNGPLIDDPIAGNDTGGILTEGQLDPDNGSFVFKTLTTAPDRMRLVPVQLVGSNLVVDADSNLISLDVAIQNLHSAPLHGPAAIFISQLVPEGVRLLNPDAEIANVDSSANRSGAVEYYFDYSELLGPDDILQPEETSGSRVWVFDNPEMVPFSFAARVEFALVPDHSRIAGICFWDSNINGRIDHGDHPHPGGLVEMISPDGTSSKTFSDQRGKYSFAASETGLYTLTFDPMIQTMSIAPIIFTTPNPRQIMILPGDDGLAQSYRNANFGMGNAPHHGVKRIQFSESIPDSLHKAHWAFMGADILRGKYLKISVGHSGCNSVQPTSLIMSGGFQESDPVQVDVVFVNLTEEACDAWFETDYIFDLGPLYFKFLEIYGPGLMTINLVDYEGVIHKLPFPVYPED